MLQGATGDAVVSLYTVAKHKLFVRVLVRIYEISTAEEIVFNMFTCC